MSDNRFIIKNGAVVESTLSGTTVFEIEGVDRSLLSVTDSTTGEIFNIPNVTGGTALNVSAEGNILVGNNITASQFIKSGGTSTQFLKADGSSDSNTYSQTGHTHSSLQSSIYNTADLNTLNFTGGFSAKSALSTSPNIFPTVNNANAVLTVDMYEGGAAEAYQLGFSSSGNFYSRFGNATWYKVWSELNFNPANYLPLAGGTLTSDLTIAGGADLNLKAPINSDDSGDLVFLNGSGAELHRLWGGTGTLNYRANAGTTYELLHTGNFTSYAAPASHNQAWSTITGTPTTLTGYGITDAAPSTHYHDSRYQQNILVTGTTDTNAIGGLSAIANNNWANSPSNKIGILYTNATYASNWIVQDFHSIEENRRFFRNYNGTNAAFTSWFEFWHTGNFNPSNYLTTTAAASTYLGISAKAVDSDKLDGNDSTYFASASSLSNYLHLTSGGTVSAQAYFTGAPVFSNTFSLYVRRPGENNPNIVMQNHDSLGNVRTLGYLTMLADDNLGFFRADGVTYRTVLHSGNFTSYASPLGHAHDERYYTETESDSRYAYKAGSSDQDFYTRNLTINRADSDSVYMGSSVWLGQTYIGLRAGIDKSFNIDTYNSGSSLNTLKILQSGLTTITSTYYDPLRINNISATPQSAVEFQLSGTTKAYIGYHGIIGAFLQNGISPYGTLGVLDDTTPYYSPNGGTTKHTLIHSGNYSSYASPLNHSHSYFYNGNSFGGDCNALAEDYKLSFTSLIISSATNLFPVSNNANAIISIATHSGGYNHQLGFSSNGNIYSRQFSAGTAYAWKRLIYSDNPTFEGVVTAPSFVAHGAFKMGTSGYVRGGTYELLFNSAADANMMHHDASNLYVYGNVYVGGNGWNSGNAVIHSGNIGSQSVNYATSAGNADTLDTYHATSFLRKNETYAMDKYVLESIPKNTTQVGYFGWVDYQTTPYAGGGFLTLNMGSSLRSLLMIFPDYSNNDNIKVLTSIDGAAWGQQKEIAWKDHNHDDRYYTETEIDNYFSGAVGITGYNKSNWDTAYSYSQIGHLPLSGGTLRGSGSVALTLDSPTTTTALLIKLNGLTQGYLGYSSSNGIVIANSYTTPTALIGILYNGMKTAYFSSDNGITKNTLLHAGNYHSYALSVSGGTISAAIPTLSLLSTQAGSNKYTFYGAYSTVDDLVLRNDTTSQRIMRVAPNSEVFFDKQIYTLGNAVIHSGNIGSQSVNYAASAGNADTLDGYHAVNFTRSADMIDSGNWNTISLTGDNGSFGARVESGTANPPAAGMYNWSLWQQGTSTRGSQLALGAYGGNRMFFRGANLDTGSFRGWAEVWHTDNLPNPLNGTGTVNYVPKFINGTTVADSSWFIEGYVLSQNIGGSPYNYSNRIKLISESSWEMRLRHYHYGYGYSYSFSVIDPNYNSGIETTMLSFDRGRVYIPNNLNIGYDADLGYKLAVNGSGYFNGTLTISKGSLGDVVDIYANGAFAGITLAKSNQKWALVSGNNGGSDFSIEDRTANLSGVNSPFVIQGGTGRVGIGTTNPYSKLHIVSSSTTEALPLRIDNPDSSTSDAKAVGLSFWGADSIGTSKELAKIVAGTTGSGGYNFLNSNLNFYTRSNNAMELRMVIRDNGNIGIGTVTPYSMLDVFVRNASNRYLTISTDDGYGSWNDYGINFRINNIGHDIARIKGQYINSGGGGYGELLFSTRSAGVLYDRLHIAHSGNISIGWGSDQGYKLAVAGSGYFSGYFKTELTTSNNTAVAQFINNVTGSFVWGIATYAPNLGVNTNVINLIGVGGSSRNSAYMGFTYVGAGSYSNKMTFGFHSNDHLLTINPYGAAVFSGSASSVTAPAFYHSSDMTLKNIISPLESSLDKLRNMSTFYYTLKDDSSQRIQLGMSAQEFDTYFPTLVGRDSNDKLLLDYPRIAVIAIKAVQEIDIIQQQHEKEVAELKAKIEKLENRFRKLEEKLFGSTN